MLICPTSHNFLCIWSVYSCGSVLTVPCFSPEIIKNNLDFACLWPHSVYTAGMSLNEYRQGIFESSGQECPINILYRKDIYIL